MFLTQMNKFLVFQKMDNFVVKIFKSSSFIVNNMCGDYFILVYEEVYLLH